MESSLFLKENGDIIFSNPILVVTSIHNSTLYTVIYVIMWDLSSFFYINKNHFCHFLLSSK